MKKSLARILLLTLLAPLFLLTHSGTGKALAQTTTYFTDGFERNDIFDGNWELGGEGRAENFTTTATKRHSGRRSLKVRNTKDGGLQALNHRISQSNLKGIVSVAFYDFGGDYSAGSVFSVANHDTSQYLIFQIDEGKPNFVYRVQDQLIDSGVPRTAGWHTLSFVVTEHGSYGQIDGVSLSNLGANFDLTEVGVVSLGRGWGKEGSTYFDTLKMTSLFDLPQSQQVILDSWSDEVYRIYKDSDLSEVIDSLNNQRTHGIARNLSAQAMMHFYYYLRDGNPTDFDKTLDLTRIVIDSYQYWGRVWLSPITMNHLAFNVWGMWEYLDLDLRSDFLKILSEEANFRTWIGYSRKSRTVLTRELFPQKQEGGPTRSST